MAKVIVRNLDDEVVSSLQTKPEVHGHFARAGAA
jgi:plasmid stability protein